MALQHNGMGMKNVVINCHLKTQRNVAAKQWVKVLMTKIILELCSMRGQDGAVLEWNKLVSLPNTSFTSSSPFIIMPPTCQPYTRIPRFSRNQDCFPLYVYIYTYKIWLHFLFLFLFLLYWYSFQYYNINHLNLYLQ